MMVGEVAAKIIEPDTSTTGAADATDRKAFEKLSHLARTFV